MGRGTLLILGSGLENLYEDETEDPFTVKTRFGEVEIARIKNGRGWIMQRHGKNHSVPPHLLNHHANISAATELGAAHIISTSAVGAIDHTLTIGNYVVADQFIDMHRGSNFTIFESDNFEHTDMSQPYSEKVRGALIGALESNGLTGYSAKGTYVCTDGPRFETPAEIKAYKMMGGDVVGMTAVPEAILAKELGIPYATLAIVTNMAAGMQRKKGTQGKISHEETEKNIGAAAGKTKQILDGAVMLLEKG